MYQIESVKFGDSSKHAEYLDSLERTLSFCKIPRDGINNSPAAPIHAAQVFIFLNDLPSADDALRSGKYSMTDEQRFQLLSDAAMSNDERVLDLILEAGIDPTLRQPRLGITAVMNAAHAGTSAVVRMQRFADLGVDPFAQMPTGFSALDFAIAANNEDAIGLVLHWIDEAGPEKMRLVRYAIAVAEQTDPARAESLREWLMVRSID